LANNGALFLRRTFLLPTGKFDGKNVGALSGGIMEKKSVPKHYQDNRLGGFISAMFGPEILERPRLAFRFVVID